MKNLKTPQGEHCKVLALFFKEVMEARQMSQSQLAEKVGIHRSTIKRFFDLEFCLRFDLVIKIVQALELNMFFETRDSKTDLNIAFEKAMEQLGRRPDKLSKN